MLEFICNIWKVEHGSSALIKTPNEKIILMDAGCSEKFSPSSYLYHKWGINYIDALVISHPHKDHIQDLPIMRSLITIKSRYWNSLTPERLIYPSGKENLREPLASWFDMSNTYTGSVPYNESITNANFTGGVEINTFRVSEEYLNGSAKDNINNYSLLTTIFYKGLLIIFPGDLEPSGWDAILNHTPLLSYLNADYKILIASHHGRKSGIRNHDGTIYSRFLSNLNPNLVIISDVWGNETTDPEAYRPFCSGINVESFGNIENKKILTTKINDCVSIQIENNVLSVKRF